MNETEYEMLKLINKMNVYPTSKGLARASPEGMAGVVSSKPQIGRSSISIDFLFILAECVVRFLARNLPFRVGPKIS